MSTQREKIMVVAPKPDRVIIVGAGIGGLFAAIGLAAKGFDVLVLEKELKPGGKARTVRAGRFDINAGPTVFTMKWVFDRLLAESGYQLEDVANFKPIKCLARHFWRDGSTLDLFADQRLSYEAICQFSNEENAKGYERFCTDSARVFNLLKETYIAAQRPSPIGLMQRIGLSQLTSMLKLNPFSNLWNALADYFPDPRLQQLFARYSTYCGSSPFLSPATLMLVAHVEQDGVWTVDGGMAGFAEGLAKVAQNMGVKFWYGQKLSRFNHDGENVTSVVLESGDALSVSAVIYNGDVSSIAKLTGKKQPSPIAQKSRSLSAMTFAIDAPVTQFPLAHHSVFFSDQYQAEFDTIFKNFNMPLRPTTYICAPERSDLGSRIDTSDLKREPLFALINAPANGDEKKYCDKVVQQNLDQMLDHLSCCGLIINQDDFSASRTTPKDFNALFPASGGALYGRASHGWMASFQRQGSKTALKNLYLAGGSVHPGPGVPMAALSGGLAVESLMKDRALTPLFRRAGTYGGISTG